MEGLSTVKTKTNEREFVLLFSFRLIGKYLHHTLWNLVNNLHLNLSFVYGEVLAVWADRRLSLLPNLRPSEPPLSKYDVIHRMKPKLCTEGNGELAKFCAL